MIPNFWTDRFGQTLQIQIRLLLEEQSDLGLHCLLFHLHSVLNFRCTCITAKFLASENLGTLRYNNFYFDI